MSTLIPQEKIRAAINSLENEKSPGQDNLGAEVCKADPQLVADLLQPLLRDIWEETKLPGDRTEGVTVKIPKKGALKNCRLLERKGMHRPDRYPA